MTAASAAACSLPPVRTSCHVPLALMASISEETISLWLKLGALEKLEQAVLDGYGDQLCGKTSRIPQVNKFLKQVPLFQNKIKEIHKAVTDGRIRDVQHLIDRKKLAFCRDETGATPLHKAVIFANMEIIEYLVGRYGGVIHVRDHQGRTPLHYAAFLPDGGEIYQFLLTAGSDERAMDVYGRQPSHYIDGQNETILRQLKEGTGLNGVRKLKPRYYSQTSCNKTAENGTRPMVSKLHVRELIADGSLDALEDLVLQGHGDRLLGETSKDPRIQTFLNIVPIYMERIYDVHRAVMRDQLEHVVILLENRRLAIARDQLGATPLHKAVLFGHYKITHFISQRFPETLNTLDLEGRTPLHYAAALRDNKHMYDILVEGGANKGIFDNCSKTAEHYLQYPEHLNLDEVIKKCHKVNATYLANTANRIKAKSPTRQTPPPSNGNSNSPRSDDNNGSSKESGLSGENETEPDQIFAMLQTDNLARRAGMSSANIKRWFEDKDVEKLERAVMEGYGEKVVRVKSDGENEENPDDDADLSDKMSKMVERVNAVHLAVYNDDLKDLQNQLEEKDFAMAKDHQGMTPLHRAILLGRTKIAKYLVDKFPEAINMKNKEGRTALHFAAAMSRKDGQNLYKHLLQGGSDSRIRDNHGRTADYYKTHLLTLPNKGLTKKGSRRDASLRHTDSLNRYSKQGVLERMTTALQRGDGDLLQELTLEGHGRHLLGKTSWNDECRQFLKELPAYLASIQSIHTSCKEGNISKLKELLNTNGRLLKARDETGACPVHIAAQIRQMDAIDFFVNNYPLVINYKDGSGRTALHIASQNNDQNLCKVLKEAGADCKLLDHKGRTAEFYLQNAKDDNSSGNLDISRTLANEMKHSQGNIKPQRQTRKRTQEKEADEKTEEKPATRQRNYIPTFRAKSLKRKSIAKVENIELEKLPISESKEKAEIPEEEQEPTCEAEKDEAEAKSCESESCSEGDGRDSANDALDECDKLGPEVDKNEGSEGEEGKEAGEEDEEPKEDVPENELEEEEKEADEKEEKNEDEAENPPDESEQENCDDAPEVVEETENTDNAETDAPPEEVSEEPAEEAEDNPATDAEPEEKEDEEKNEEPAEENAAEDGEEAADAPEADDAPAEDEGEAEDKPEESAEPTEEATEGEDKENVEEEKEEEENKEDGATEEAEQKEEEGEEKLEDENENDETKETEAEETENKDPEEEEKVDEPEEENPEEASEEKPEGGDEEQEESPIAEPENEEESEVKPEEEETERKDSCSEEVDENKAEEVLEADETTEETKAEESDDQTHQTKDHLDELIEHWIKEGDLLRLEHVVLAGQGDRLIERTSDDKQVQDFLDLVPIYMAKIRAVHEAVVKGQLRDVRSILTRKRFALSRDHVGASPLHLAVLHGHADVATYIISHFPETMDGPDNEGRTPLHYAAALQDNGALYKVLKAAGADENIEDKSGHSPKYYYSNAGRLTLSEILEPYLIIE